MRKRMSLLLAVLMVCLCLGGCVDREAEETVPSTESSVQMTEAPQPTTDPGTVIEKNEQPSEALDLPEIEMPTEPDADYQLPPGEKPEVTVINK